ncbi:ran-binding protein [Blastomyces dermatitidis ER-3]|uniref:Protein FYV10 n=2 Tax=Ajellomyces dermatitidis TaxID=5039 RepID=F2THJ3_AJEDA|nr:ran-binding protein [Blastomyces dermatitidis ER-3]EEQ86752.1 ran-binding protein [Blastomyces dermatitidis ER-3]EGE82706.1 ran-binding protein [Blastomyces dermatitidis ATCC 18188]
MSNNAPPGSGGGGPPISYPAPPPSFSSMPRRSSYASVVSGTAALANSTPSNTSNIPTAANTTSSSSLDPASSQNLLQHQQQQLFQLLQIQQQQQQQQHNPRQHQQHPSAWSGPHPPSFLSSSSASGATPSNSFPPHYIPPDSRAHSSGRHVWVDSSVAHNSNMQPNGASGGGGGGGGGAAGSPWRRSLPPNSTSTNPATTSGLPFYSRQFATYPDHYSPSPSPYTGFLHGPSSSPATSFFTPSYLRNSKYIAQLAAAHRSNTFNAATSSSSSAAISSTQKDSASNHSSASTSSNTAATANNAARATNTNTSSNTTPGAPPLSTNSSNVNLHRLAPSHRGMTHEIIEHPPSSSDDESTPIMPLPSRWSDQYKNAGLDLLSDGLEVRYLGNPLKLDHEAASCRADHPMPPQCGIYYFEVTIMSKPKDGMICVGFTSNKASLERLPGWEPESWAYHGDDGRTFFGETQGQGTQYGPKYSVNDTIGCGVNFSTSTAFFTRNGVFLGDAFRELRNVKLYPAVGVKKQPTTHLKANFGQSPFIYDIDGLMEREKLKVQADIRATSISNLHSSLDETTFIQELVAQFLAHGGYVETARAFAEEVQEESRALQNGRETPLKDYQAEEDGDAIKRQRIRTAILDGDIDKALKLTNASYADVLVNNPQIYFRLRCRKFIEMMRRCTEPQPTTSSTSKQAPRSPNGATSMSVYDTSDDVFAHDMELDEQMNDVIDDDDEDDNGSLEAGGRHDDRDDNDDQALDDDDDDDENGMDVEESAEYNGTPRTTTQPQAANVANYHGLLHKAILYGQELQADYPGDERREYKRALDDIFSLVAYSNPKSSVHGHLLEPSGRVPVAEELNSAILVFLGKSSSAALEKLYQQTEVLVNEISEDGGAGAFINVRHDFVI